MTPQEQIEYAADVHISITENIYLGMIANHRLAFITGGLKGMEIQKEIDRQEIERLKAELRADQIAFESVHLLYPEIGMDERSEYLKTILKP